MLDLERRNLRCVNIPIGRKVDELDHLSKLRKILSSFLNFLQSVSNCLGLVDNLKDCIPHRALMEQIVDGRHFGKVLDVLFVENCPSTTRN
jgi:hypothetical protein